MVLIFLLFAYTLTFCQATQPESNPMDDDLDFLIDSLTDDMIWQQLQLKYTKSATEIHLVTGNFYDQHLVSRWTSAWLDADAIWIIGVTKDAPINSNY